MSKSIKNQLFWGIKVAHCEKKYHSFNYHFSSAIIECAFGGADYLGNACLSFARDSNQL